MVRSALVGTLAYLALPSSAGRRGRFLLDPARTTVAIITVELSVAGLFSGANLSPGVREDRADRWVLVAFLVLALLAAICRLTPIGRISGHSTRTRSLARRRALRAARELPGWALTFRSAVGVPTALMLLTLLRASARKRRSRTQFGAEYDGYRARTSRLIPGLY